MADDNVLKVQIQLDDGTVAQGFAKIQKEGESAFGAIGNVAAGVLASQAITSALGTIKGVFDQAIEAAASYGVEVQKLNGNLALAGQYSEATSKQFTDLADRIQATTAFSDDQVLSIAALGSNFTHSAEQTRKLTTATLDFAAATGKDANDAAQQLSLTLQGNIGRLGRYFPELKRFTEAQLEAGAAVDFIAKRFDGAAASQSNTYAASVRQLANAYDDVLKSIGQFRTESPTVIVSLKFLATELLGVADSLAKVRGQADSFKGIATSIQNLGLTVSQSVLPVFEVFYNVLASTGGVVAGLIKAFNQITVFQDYSAALDELKNAKNSFVGFKDALETPISDASAGFFERYGIALETATQKQAEFVNQVRELKPKIEQALPERDVIFGLGDAFNQLAIGVAQSIDNILITALKTMRTAADTAVKGFANAFTSGFAAVGKALVKGQDVFAAFGAALLASLGQAATQLGGTFILMGLGKTLIGDPSGPALVAVGGALAVLGGALSAFGDGVTGTSNPATSVNTGGGSAIDTSASTSSSTANTIAQTQSAGVTVNIQGDVLDSRETGLRIVDLINDSFSQSGAKVAYS